MKELEGLLRRKTEHIKIYGHVLAPQSNYYRRHQMVRSFLWAQSNKEKNVVRQGLAQIVAQSFNRQAYTRRKTVQWERSWVRYRGIPDTKAGGIKGIYHGWRTNSLFF